MRPLEYPLLLDENIHPAVLEALRAGGRDVQSVFSKGAIGASDVEVLELATSEGRLVVTHDSDFGTLAVRAGRGLVGIVYLRPGHIRPPFVLEILDVLSGIEAEPTPPFIVVADRRGDGIRVRIRELPATQTG